MITGRVLTANQFELRRSSQGLAEAGRSDLNSGFEGIHQTEGGDVGPAVLELLQVGQVKVEVGDEVVVVGGHHAHSLGLPQHPHHILHVAVQHDVNLTGLLHLTQDSSGGEEHLMK